MARQQNLVGRLQLSDIAEEMPFEMRTLEAALDFVSPFPHICEFKCIYTHMRACPPCHTYAYPCHTYAHSCHTHVTAYVHSCHAFADSYAYAHTCVPVRAHACTHEHPHAHTRTHACRLWETSWTLWVSPDSPAAHMRTCIRLHWRCNRNSPAAHMRTLHIRVYNRISMTGTAPGAGTLYRLSRRTG